MSEQIIFNLQERVRELQEQLNAGPTPAFVRARLRPLLEEDPSFDPHLQGVNQGIHAAARALLGLPDDAPSPLDE